MARFNVCLSLALAACAVALGAVSGPPAVVAGPAAPIDLVGEWDKQWDRAIKESATAYRALALKHEKKLEATSAYTRRFVLRYLPDDEETRKFLGYTKGTPDANGVVSWVREDVRHDQIKELTDTDDPKGSKYPKDLAEANKKVANFFRGLAKKAAENGAAKDASPDAKWNERAARAWERVLELDDGSTNFDDAHKALNHPKFGNKYCSPFKFKFMQAREDRKKLGEAEHAAVIKPVDAVEPDGPMVEAGLAGGGAKSTHIVINTTHGKDIALSLAASFEKGLNDLVAVVGLPETAKERVPLKRLILVKDEEEWKKVMAKGLKFTAAEVQRYVDAHLLGTGRGGDYVTPRGANASADDFCMNIGTLNTFEASLPLAVADVGGDQRRAEDWLGQSVAYDVTQRVNGTKDTHWGAFGRYGDTIDAPPGQDKWIELARRQVISDDDVPLAQLYKKKLDQQELKGPDLVKGWAFLQFLYEDDKESGKKFVWNALAKGTPAACAAVYPDSTDSSDPGKAMEAIDARYREWILKAW